MIKFNLGGSDICVTFGFLFTISILLFVNSPSVKFEAISAYIVHELGHYFTAVILNVKFKSFRLWAGGVNIQMKNEMISYEKELAVLISGPLMNIAFSVFCVICGMNEPAEINITLALFNLLPYSSLDGGCILRSIFEYNEKNGLPIQRSAAVVTGILIIIICFTRFPENILTQATMLLLIADELT